MDVGAALGRPPDGRRRIPAVLWDAVVAAEACRASARADARAIVERATLEADALRAAASARGRDEGLASVTELHARALRDRDRLLDEARQDLVALAFGVAERVIGALVREHPELVVGVAREAIEASRARGELTVRAAAESLEVLRAAEPELARERGGPRIRLVRDDGLAPGGVVVETELGRVDASLEAQLAALRRAVADAPGGDER